MGCFLGRQLVAGCHGGAAILTLVLTMLDGKEQAVCTWVAPCADSVVVEPGGQLGQDAGRVQLRWHMRSVLGACRKLAEPPLSHMAPNDHSGHLLAWNAVLCTASALRIAAKALS